MLCNHSEVDPTVPDVQASVLPTALDIKGTVTARCDSPLGGAEGTFTDSRTPRTRTDKDVSSRRACFVFLFFCFLLKKCVKF